MATTEKPKKTISLSGSINVSKDDILKKFIKTSTSDSIVHKNLYQQTADQPKEEEIEEANAVKPVDEFYQEKPIYEADRHISTEHVIHKINKQIPPKKEKQIANISTNITANTKIENNSKPLKAKEKPETQKVVEENISLFGTKTENNSNAIVISLEEEEVEKEDKRDKSLIEKTLRHYKYLEFDNDTEIDSLRAGENLRAMLETKRALNEEEEIEVLSSFASDEQRSQRRRKPDTYSHSKRKDKNIQKQEAIIREIKIPDLISVQELANRLSLKIALVIEKTKYIGEVVDEDSIIDGDVAELVVEEFGQKVLRVKEKTPEDILERKALKTNLQISAPVVTVMGHVDHGKTSLLDALRQTDVTLGEFGGITQHIGAYQVEMESGKKITFIDTPGHEAFTAMRARGANATDIVVLVIAADDSVNKQTIEAISHAKAAQVPIIVAVNKMDLPGADIQKVKNDLLAQNLIPEDFGGDIPVMPVSALKKTGLKELEERILLQADVMDLKVNHSGHAGGVVLESRLDNKKGVVATVLIKHGILKNGDVILSGTTYGRVRVIMNDKAHTLQEALPSMPVEVYGFTNVPTAGERFFVLESEKSAREVIAHRTQRIHDELQELSTSSDPFAALLKKEKKSVSIIIRSDTHGTLDAIKYTLDKIEHEEIKLHIVQALVGNVTEADILLAKTNGATIFAFNVVVGSSEDAAARKHNIAIRQHNVIYKMVDEIKVLLSKSLAPIVVETKIGTAIIRQVFDVSKHGKIAGLFVQDGQVKRNALAKIIRGGVEIAKGNVDTLKHFQEDVKVITQGMECGAQISGFSDYKSNDIIEIYEISYEVNKID